MNRAPVFLSFTGISVFLLFSSCKRNPIDRLVDPLPDNSLPQSSGVYMIYDDELRTGGGLAFIPGPESQEIDLAARVTPRRSINTIRYFWNGNDVFNSSTGMFQHLFAGFMTTVTPDAAGLDAATGKNLSAAGYTRLRLFVKGSLSHNTRLRIEGPDDGAGGITPERTEIFTLGPDWQEITLTIPPAHFSNVKVFFILSFQYTQPARSTAAGGGGEVYVDDVRYER